MGAPINVYGRARIYGLHAAKSVPVSQPARTGMPRTIPTKESMTIEFKSDRGPVSDSDLINAVVCLANGEGGEIYLGVENSGDITGLHATHRNLSTLAAFIANKTNPPVSVRVTPLD